MMKGSKGWELRTEGRSNTLIIPLWKADGKAQVSNLQFLFVLHLSHSHLMKYQITTFNELNFYWNIRKVCYWGKLKLNYNLIFKYYQIIIKITRSVNSKFITRKKTAGLDIFAQLWNGVEVGTYHPLTVRFSSIKEKKRFPASILQFSSNSRPERFFQPELFRSSKFSKF